MMFDGTASHGRSPCQMHRLGVVPGGPEPADYQAGAGAPTVVATSGKALTGPGRRAIYLGSDHLEKYFINRRR